HTPAVGAAAFSGRTKYSSSSASDRRRTGFRSLTPGFDWSEPSRFHGILQAQLQEIVASGDGTFRRKRWRGSPVDSNRPRRSPEGSAPRVGIAHTARLNSRSWKHYPATLLAVAMSLDFRAWASRCEGPRYLEQH